MLYQKIARVELPTRSLNLAPVTLLRKWNLLMCLSSSKDFKKHRQTSSPLPMLTFQTPNYSSRDRWYLEYFSDRKSHLMNSLFHCWNVSGEPKRIFSKHWTVSCLPATIACGIKLCFQEHPRRADLVSYTTVQTCLAIILPSSLPSAWTHT